MHKFIILSLNGIVSVLDFIKYRYVKPYAILDNRVEFIERSAGDMACYSVKMYFNLAFFNKEQGAGTLPCPPATDISHLATVSNAVYMKSPVFHLALRQGRQGIAECRYGDYLSIGNMLCAPINAVCVVGVMAREATKKKNE